MQLIHTKYFGTLAFEQTWAVHNGIHIGRLANGAYAHLGGLPVSSADELRLAIPDGDDLKEALDWWEHKDERAAKASVASVRRVYYGVEDRSWRYVDTDTMVDKAEDLYEALKGSQALEEAMGWFYGRSKAAPHQQGESALTPASGFAPDERLIAALGRAGDEGLTLHEASGQLKIDPKAMAELLGMMMETQRIRREGKRFYLPEKPVAVGAGEGGDQDDGEED